MGNFFISTQIYNKEQIEQSKYIELFCQKMKEEGYELCESDDAETSYILAFSDNSKWITITSEEYENDNKLAQNDAERIADMMNTFCINTSVIDSDCAIMDLYDENGSKADSLIMGRADDYLGDNIPSPDESKWKSFATSWEQFSKIINGEYVFIEDGLSMLATVLSMDSKNILFSAEDAVENNETVILDFKKSRPSITMFQGGKAVAKTPQKLTLNTAFKQIIGNALEPYGFKAIKGRHPYIVRAINNEILHIITFRTESPDYSEGDKAFAIMGGIATVYRKKITLDQSPIQNYIWFNYMFDFYEALTDERHANILDQLFRSCYYSDKPESLISVMNTGAENVIKYILPVMDKINDIDSSLDYMRKFKKPCNSVKCTKICTYYPDEDESFLYFLSDKKEEYSDILANFNNDKELHNWVMCEIEKRKTENLDLLKKYGIV